MGRFTLDLHEGTDGGTYVRTYVGTVDDVMAIKPNFLALMGYQYFLSYGAPRARSSAIRSKSAHPPGAKPGQLMQV